MIHKHGRLIAVVLALIFMVLPGLAQTKKKRKAASLDGPIGLFHVWDAEPSKQGEFNVSLGYENQNRDPGQLNIKTVPLAFSVGLMNRVELFAGFDPFKRITANDIKYYRVLPGQLPRPATTPLGVTYFTNEAPFMDVPRSNGMGDSRLGGKFNIFSENAGAPLGLSVVGFVNFPRGSSEILLNRAMTSGVYSGGYGVLVSKRAGDIAILHFNSLLNYMGDPSVNGVQLANLQNEFIYRGGAAFPLSSSVEAIAELDGKVYFGDKTAGLNPRSPLDLLVGMRGYIGDKISASVGYRAALNHIKEDPAAQIYHSGTNGMVAQLAYGHHRNDPPTVTCAVANASIKQDEKTTIRASATDPDRDPLTYKWSSSGGKFSGTGDTANFDATGVAPGRYTVTATVSDGKHEASCTSEITVIKKNLPPTVSCSPGSATVTIPDSTTIRATASDPNNDSLTYSWSVNGQKVASDGPTINFGTSGRQAGNYTVAVAVSDGEFTANCSSTVTVKEPVKINKPPVIECLTTSVDVLAGSSVELKAKASDPDGDRTTVSWSATGGSVRGSGENATFDASGVKAGIYNVTATADDGRGGKASCTMTVNVSERLVLTGFTPSGARIDNVMKAALDDLAVRMKNDTKLNANIIGYTDGSRAEASAAGKKLGQKRAEAAVNYLVKKGADASRLKATDGGSKNQVADPKTAAGRKQNRRLEIEISAK